MKKLSRLICVFMCAIMFVSVFSACGGGDENTNRPKSISVMVFSGGYGSEWLEAVADDYMENIDTETYVDIKDTVLNAQEVTKVQQGLVSCDIYLLEGNFTVDDPLVDLTDFIEEYPTGESEHTIREKMGELYNFYNDEGKVVSLPYSDNHYYSFAMNRTIIDSALGEGTWHTPRTTEEFFELGDRLAEQGVYLMGSALGDMNDYFDLIARVWFAQYAGWDAYVNYMEGNYFDESKNEYVFAENSPIMIEQQRDAIYAKYNNTLKLFTKQNGYIHKDSGSMDFMNVEASFYGYGYGIGNMKQAFIAAGPWLENEAEVLFDTFGAPEVPQEIEMIRIPIVSEMASLLEGASGSEEEKEDQLRDLISYVDGETDTAPEWATENDIARVTEARKMIAKNTTGSIVIPLGSSKIEEAKKFLKYLTSDRAREISMESTNGINMLSFDAYAEPSENLKFSDYIISVDKIIENTLNIDVNPKIYDFAYYGQFLIDDASLGCSMKIFSQSSANTQPESAEKYYTSLYNYYNGRWGTMVTAYKNAIS